MKKNVSILFSVLFLVALLIYSFYYYQQADDAKKEVNKMEQKVELKNNTIKELKIEKQTYEKYSEQSKKEQKAKTKAYQDSKAIVKQLNENENVLHAFFDYTNQDERLNVLKEYVQSDLLDSMKQAKSDSEQQQATSHLEGSQVYYSKTEKGFSTLNVINVSIESENHEDVVTMLAHFNYTEENGVYKITQSKFTEY
ncbi:hypothetical protein [Listeria seeligeri]|uniref:hypothetical protein n=1 Tax=Listeria seeligeri TaxID=1640 RepID=UPI001628CAF6|nr:hypothetical protein [Listeria seeligeri]EFU7331873.1 hypothetical protein [Listeria monocytogenes]MBC1479257.1 hypothetical protein [Listeria seeligeri]MBC1929562.1 hypothetical protein [Listeria seeligeri]MBC6113370.1 hypothetical protein [Listeria seeligeri]MBC6159473.1 hypothetical protein [Listeria seeligeri]